MKKITLPLLLTAASFFGTNLLYAQSVGIGTTSPYAPLHVKTNSFEVLRLEGSTIPSLSMYDNGTYRGSLIARAADFELYSPLPIMMAPGSTTTATFLPNGHVGIGTTTPSERLHVIHTADVNKNAIYGYASQASGSTDYQNTGVTGFGQGNGLAPGGYGYGFGVKGIGSLNSFGAVGVYAGLGTTVPQNNSIGGRFYSLYADAGIPAANHYAAAFLNGNVGIGNSTPQYMLDVAGDINLTGAFKVAGISGVAGQVLASNGGGAPAWQNTALSNDTRFSFTIPSQPGNSAYMTFTTNYNTNTTNIVVPAGGSQININKTGLYHFEGLAVGTVNFSSFPSGYTPYFDYTLTVSVGFTPYYYSIVNNIPMHLIQTAIPGYHHSERFTIDLFITAGSILSLSSYYYSPGPATSFATQGWFTGYLISD
ncbi:MAG: hypothetical protein ABIX01_00395 [Chitinophagaceae bacterium]